MGYWWNDTNRYWCRVHFFPEINLFIHSIYLNRNWRGISDNGHNFKTIKLKAGPNI